jgi:hypothetical protein
VNALCVCFVLIQGLENAALLDFSPRFRNRKQHIDLPEDGFGLWFGSRDCQSIPHKSEEVWSWSHILFVPLSYKLYHPIENRGPSWSHILFLPLSNVQALLSD